MFDIRIPPERIVPPYTFEEAQRMVDAWRVVDALFDLPPDHPLKAPAEQPVLTGSAILRGTP